MNTRPLILVSLCAVVLLVLGSLSNVVGYQSVKSTVDDSPLSNEGNGIIFHGVISIKAESADCMIPDQCHKGRLYFPIFLLQINIPFGNNEIKINGKMYELQEYPTLIILRGFLGFGPNETHGLSNITFFGICREIIVMPYSIFSDYIDKQPLFDVHDIQKFGQCAYGLASADFNKDGNMDVVTCGATSPWEEETVSILYNNGNGEFTQDDIYSIIDPTRPRYIEDLNAADYDNDGDIDLMITQSEAIWYQGNLVKINGVIKMLMNDGNNNFDNCTQITWHGPGTPYDPENRINPQLISADFDMDGDIDFLVGDNSGKVEFYINNGTGNFTSAGILHDWGSLSWGLTSNDFDGDGDIDFLVASALQSGVEGYIYLIQNQWIESNHTVCFTEGAGEILLYNSHGPACLQSFDYDADGDIDLIVGIADGVYLCMNKQSAFDVYFLGHLPPQGYYVDDLDHGGITASDFSNDGKIDIITGGVQGFVRLFINHFGQLPPFRPTIQQPSDFQAHKRLEFGFVSKDINDDNISYFIDWGDGTNSGWIGPFASGEEITVNHTWSRARSYIVSAKARDDDGESLVKEYILILFPGLPKKEEAIIRSLYLFSNNNAEYLTSTTKVESLYSPEDTIINYSSNYSNWKIKWICNQDSIWDN